MVTPFSDGGGVRVLLLFGAATVSGLLVVTNFPTGSAALLVDGFAFTELVATGLTWATGLAGPAFTAGTRLTTAGFAGAGLAAFLMGLAGAAFFNGSFFATLLTTIFDAGFVAPLFAGTDLAAGFTGFFVATGLVLAAGLVEALRATPATAFARDGAFATFA